MHGELTLKLAGSPDRQAGFPRGLSCSWDSAQNLCAPPGRGVRGMDASGVLTHTQPQKLRRCDSGEVTPPTTGRDHLRCVVSVGCFGGG